MLFVGEFLVAAFTVWGKLGVLILFAAVLHGVAGMRLVQCIVGDRRRQGERSQKMRWVKAMLLVPLLLCAFALGF